MGEPAPRVLDYSPWLEIDRAIRRVCEFGRTPVIACVFFNCETGLFPVCGDLLSELCPENSGYQLPRADVNGSAETTAAAIADEIGFPSEAVGRAILLGCPLPCGDDKGAVHIVRPVRGNHTLRCPDKRRYGAVELWTLGQLERSVAALPITSGQAKMGIVLDHLEAWREHTTARSLVL